VEARAATADALRRMIRLVATREAEFEAQPAAMEAVAVEAKTDAGHRKIVATHFLPQNRRLKAENDRLARPRPSRGSPQAERAHPGIRVTVR
jgi:hypothetical protein